ncbi:hypothetical protein FE257_005710 [Aspergillus nanangensis]|uniref:Uncharacterized protein n=1 Tax=Aspergillus nanangensis TaxID=2582783 RepID=A0AAD4GUF7_ASPNN|nr:hypothetical protein FE257_005710 [Aspergillus nanangensis]
MASSPIPNERPIKDALVVEAWGQGFMVGALIVMLAVTLANMKKTILHKLIAIELSLAVGHGTFIFLHAPIYGWYLSVTAIGLVLSYSIHNIVVWIKTRLFLSSWASLIYVGTLSLAQPYWALEIYANFMFFNKQNFMFRTTRPLEPLFSEPWWLLTTGVLFYTIQRSYRLDLAFLVRFSPRFGIMLLSMLLSVTLTILGPCIVVRSSHEVFPVGMDPFWKISFVFKCLSDTVMLGDFKDELDRIFRHHQTTLVRAEGPSLHSHAAVVTCESPPRLPSYNRQSSDIHALQDFSITESWDAQHPHNTPQC